MPVPIVRRLMVGGALFAAAGCHSDPGAQSPTAHENPAPVPASPLQGIWQLNYYPDSLLLKKDIYACSNWTSPYAANLRFVGDSCELSGWHESTWEKTRRVSERLHRVGSGSQYFEIEVFPDTLWFREVRVSDSGVPDSVERYPYRRVAAVLTQPGLKNRVAQEIFAGRYRVLQSDLQADSTVTLSENFGVRGLKGIAKYDVVTAMDWDFLLPNAFAWEDGKGKRVAQYSFPFAGDTLLLKDFEQRPEDESVPSGVAVTSTKARFLKQHGGHAAGK